MCKCCICIIIIGHLWLLSADLSLRKETSISPKAAWIKALGSHRLFDKPIIRKDVNETRINSTRFYLSWKSSFLVTGLPIYFLS